MAKTVKDAKLDTRAQRDKLKTGDAIHWRMLVPGKLHLGYRRRVAGNPGVWIARRFIGKSPECTSGYLKSTLGRADDYQDADGLNVLSFADAQRFAYERADTKAIPETTKVPTVREALEDYIAFLRTERKTGDGAEQAARVHILPALGAVHIDKLTLKQLEKWQSDLVSAPARLRTRPGEKQRYRTAPQTDNQKRARKATINRIVTVLKGALNRARRHHPGMPDHAWTLLKPYGKVDVARPGHLTVAEAQRLVNAADSDFRDLVRAGLMTGARYGELIRMRVRDFERECVVVPESKNGKPRDIELTEEGVAFFKALTTGRPADQLVFRHANGGAFQKSHQARPMRAACERAGITPAVGFHQLRATWASQAVANGVPLLYVAQNLGHLDNEGRPQTRMVEKHYAHLIKGHVRATIREHAPRFEISPPTNIVPIKEAI